MNNETDKNETNQSFKDYEHFDDITCLQTEDGNLLRGIFAYGFERPSLIQSKTIDLINSGVDIVAQSQAGTGKTGAFVLPMIQKILQNPSERVLILVPTRELGQQIRDEIVQFASGMKIYTALVIGGTNISQQIYNLSKTDV